jgi:hypothetical protein
MSGSDKDVAITARNVEGSVVPEASDLPLTPEQRAFAEVIGREIARFWKEAHRDGHSLIDRHPDPLKSNQE